MNFIEQYKYILLRIRLFLLWAICVVVFLVLFVVVHVQTAHLIDIIPTTGELMEKAPVVLVLGAAVKEDGDPSDALKDRLLVGIDVWKRGYAERILVTGDDGKFHTDEVSVMKKFLMDQGVPEEDILVDGKGYRTFESCRRAKEELKIDHAIIITQRFHMARALYLCEALGVDSVGVTSDLQPYEDSTYYWLRDLAASVKAFWEINKDRPPNSIAI
jgi:SanA protein